MTEVFAFIIGTRAQLVKMAPVMRAANAAGHPTKVILTGQHYESMSELAIDLGIGESFVSEELGTERSTVAKLLTWIPSAFVDCRRRLMEIARSSPTLVLVHGDTASTLLGAMAARSIGLPVVHIESGLTSGDLFDPFPEELLRRLVFRLTTIAVCPSDVACRRMERYACMTVINSGGNTIADALALALQQVPDDATQAVDIVVSLHRFENIRSFRRLEYIVSELIKISERQRVAFVLHPSTLSKLHSFGLYEILQGGEGIDLLPRMPYTRFIAMVSRAQAVITDGGSNQEEFALMGIPTVVLRQRSERSDGLGSNAILERDIGVPLSEFINRGCAAKLRKPAVGYEMGRISERVVAGLEGCLAPRATDRRAESP